MSGIPYPPPDNILPIFDRVDFISEDTGSLDVATATAYFVKYPSETRTINLADVNISGTATFSNALNVTSATPSTNTGTGALVVTGGVGVGGTLNTSSIATTGTASFSGAVSITNNTPSTTTGTGALVVTGGVGIGGALNVGTTLTAPQIEATTNGFYAYDGANEGRMYQVGTELTLASSGNKVALATSNTLVFKNDNTTQLSAYTGREVADDADIFTFVNNAVSPASQRYTLSSTFSMGNITPTNNYSVAAINRIYFFPIRLIKGQIADGIGFYLTAATAAPSTRFCFYSRAGVRIRTPGTTNVAVGTRMEFQAFGTPYIVPETDIYYIGVFVSNLNGGTLNMVATPANTYINYGNTTMTAGILDKASLYVDTGGAPPATLAGLTPVIQDRVGYGVVYSNSP